MHVTVGVISMQKPLLSGRNVIMSGVLFFFANITGQVSVGKRASSEEVQ